MDLRRIMEFFSGGGFYQPRDVPTGMRRKKGGGRDFAIVLKRTSLH